MYVLYNYNLLANTAKAQCTINEHTYFILKVPLSEIFPKTAR